MNEKRRILNAEIKRRSSVLGLSPKKLSLDAGLNETAVKDILSGKSENPKHETLSKIAKRLGCTVADLFREKTTVARLPDRVTINELDVHIAAGLGVDSAGELMASNEGGSIIGEYSFPAQGFREAYGAQPDGVRILPVRGDSMIPTLWPGQRVMVDTGDKLPSPPGVFVVWDGMGLVLKRIELVPASDPPRVRLMSDNARYTAYERTLEEAHINGRVIGVWARL